MLVMMWLKPCACTTGKADDSILELSSFAFTDGKLTTSRYIDLFPFPYYLVLQRLQDLPQVLSDALRQWFELLQR